MPNQKLSGVHGVALVLVLASCASVDPRPDYDRATSEIRATTGLEQVHDPEDPVLTAEEIGALLGDGLGLDEAARLALLNNRRLQAGFLALGVARADYVQAGLLENPSLSFAFLFPDAGIRGRWNADLTGSLEEIWQIPARQALAQAGLDRDILELSRFAGELVAATRTAYLEAVAARESRSLARANLELARRSLEGVTTQVERGVASRTEENLALSLSLSAELALRRSEREVLTVTRELAALLSLEADLLGVQLSDALPEPAWQPLEREQLVEASLGLRPDLRAAASAVSAAEERLGLERKRRFPEVEAGVAAERPEGGSSADLLVGPVVGLELPLFDQNQAQVSRAAFELAQVSKQYEALVAESRQGLRAALDRAELAARSATFAQEELVPQAERSAALAARAYELGDTTVLTLLAAQKAALAARRTRIDALLEAALARIDLERAFGGPLDGPPEG